MLKIIDNISELEVCQRKWLNPNDFTTVDYEEYQTTDKRPMISAWIEEHVPYDVYAIHSAITQEISEDEIKQALENYISHVKSKEYIEVDKTGPFGLYGSREVVKNDLCAPIYYEVRFKEYEYSLRKQVKMIGHRWVFYFLREDEAIYFKTTWC